MTTDFSTKPGYIRIQDEIRRRITSGEWKAGEQIPTERELEREFNMSRITISKALTTLVGEGYLTRHQGRGTFVTDQFGAGPSTGLSTAVKFITPANYRSETPVKRGAFSGMYDVLADSDYELSIDLYKKPEQQAAILRRDNVSHCAGFLTFFSSDEETTMELQRLADRNFPFVLLDAYPQEMNVDFVVTDNIDGSMQAVRHLVELGHTRITYITRPLGISSLDDRLSGFIKGLALADIPFSNENIVRLTEPGAGSLDEVVPVLDRLLSGPQRPTAIYFGNDDLALEALEFLQKEGVRVPEDLSIVGYDDVDRAAYASVPLTTVAQDFYKMCKLATEILLRKLRGESCQRPEQIYIKPHLVVRSSTGPLGG